MTRDEVKKLIRIMMATFQNFKVEDISETVDAWHFFLEAHDGGAIGLALKTFVDIKGSAFPPSVSELIALTHKPQQMAQLTEAEAWAKVRRAIGRSTYYAEEEYNKLPPECQKAVGSSNQLYAWATDEDFNESVVMSNFERAYRAVLERKNEFDAMPIEMQNRVLELQQTTSRLMIGD